MVSLIRNIKAKTVGRLIIIWGVFVTLRVMTAAATFAITNGYDLSSDARYYYYLIEHPASVLSGEILNGAGSPGVLIHYGPLLGLTIAPLFKFFRLFFTEFLAIRFAFVSLEALGLFVSYLLICRGGVLNNIRHSGGRKLPDGYLFLALAALLPLGWASTAFWVQEEILLAPFLLGAFVAAYRDKPAYAAMALVLGALVSKFLILAFVPAAWLVLTQRRRFLAYLILFALPLVCFAAYLKVRFGVIPLIGSSTVSGAITSISIFSLYEYGIGLFHLPALGEWASPISKAALVVTVATLTLGVYWTLRASVNLSLRAALSIWLVFGAGILLTVYLGQPEYLSWFTYLAPLSMVVLIPRRRLPLVATGVAVLCFTAWAWNLANGVTTWAFSTGGDAKEMFARAVVSFLGLTTVQVITIAAGFIYLAGLTLILVWSWPRRRGLPGA